MSEKEDRSFRLIDGKEVIERTGHIQGYFELLVHPDLVAKLRERAEDLDMSLEAYVERLMHGALETQVTES